MANPCGFFAWAWLGPLGYEVHGQVSDARELYSCILEAVNLSTSAGWAGYPTPAQLPEGGFPQEAYTFYTAAMEDKGFAAYLESLGYRPEIWPGHPIFVGSSGPDFTKHYRNPLELGWHKSVTFDHDFRGKAALEKELAHPTRKTVTLVWNVRGHPGCLRVPVPPGG